jgi:hypothetical protein
MSNFVLDECAYSRRLRAQCEQEGLATVKRLPRALAGSKDPELLPEVVRAGDTLLTYDREIAEQNASLLSLGHAGIVVVRSASIRSPLTDALARQILRKFKQIMPGWHSANVTNSVIEITQESVQLWHAEGGKLEQDGYLRFDRADLQEALLDVLKTNSSRCPRRLPNRSGLS